jgi:hypothetical protein
MLEQAPWTYDVVDADRLRVILAGLLTELTTTLVSAADQEC